MLFSGADLIRTSGHNADRAQRLKAVPDPAVKAVESPGESQSSLDEQTQNALLRFARFVNKEGQKKPTPKSNKKPTGSIPKAYISQAQNLNQDERSGGMLNIYI
jgi:hypothetical protein